jgi:hypothetical protein
MEGDVSDMTKEEAVSFFADFYCGAHHIPARDYCGIHGIHEFGNGWYVNHYGDLSTFDFDRLTRLVFMAHDRCIRVEIASSGPRYMKIIIHKRAQREGEIWSRHPTIESALGAWRKRNPAEMVA